MEGNFDEIIKIFGQAPHTYSSEEYIQLALLIEVILPKQGSGYIKSLYEKNGGIKVVIRFLESKRTFLSNDRAWLELRGLIRRMKEEYGKRSRRSFTLDMTTFFKVLNICSAFMGRWGETGEIRGGLKYSGCHKEPNGDCRVSWKSDSLQRLV